MAVLCFTVVTGAPMGMVFLTVDTGARKRLTVETGSHLKEGYLTVYTGGNANPVTREEIWCRKEVHSAPKDDDCTD